VPKTDARHPFAPGSRAPRSEPLRGFLPRDPVLPSAPIRPPLRPSAWIATDPPHHATAPPIRTGNRPTDPARHGVRPVENYTMPVRRSCHARVRPWIRRTVRRIRYRPPSVMGAADLPGHGRGGVCLARCRIRRRISPPTGERTPERPNGHARRQPFAGTVRRLAAFRCLWHVRPPVAPIGMDAGHAVGIAVDPSAQTSPTWAGSPHAQIRPCAPSAVGTCVGASRRRQRPWRRPVRRILRHARARLIPY